MIKSRFFKNRHGLCGFDISGHAGSDCGDMGFDLVCACVSSAVQMAANTITECLSVRADIDVSDNRIRLTLPDNEDKASRAVLEGLKLQLNLLSQNYERTINISVTEV